ncbi:MAG: GFA family protein [Sorangiineae bacterium]|nr:GFA family protein [Polyangiaceae bacterium]MEB2324418.1 GFA family protein [Sorangiineae bacterium]
MSAPRAGRCACGAIRFTTTSEPLVVLNCHCRDCQRASGTAFSTVAVFPSEALAVEGEPRWRATTAESGSVVRRGFCPECGSPLFSASDGLATLAIVKVGGFDDPSALRPTMDIWTESALGWTVMDTATKKRAKSAG